MGHWGCCGGRSGVTLGAATRSNLSLAGGLYCLTDGLSSYLASSLDQERLASSSTLTDEENVRNMLGYKAASQA